jgi:hypothetical protein
LGQKQLFHTPTKSAKRKAEHKTFFRRNYPWGKLSQIKFPTLSSQQNKAVIFHPPGKHLSNTSRILERHIVDGIFAHTGDD